MPGDKKLLENLVIKNKLGFILNSKEEIKTFISNPIKWNPSGANVSFFTRKGQTEALVLKISCFQ